MNPRPPWLSAWLPGGHGEVRAHLATLLDECVSGGRIRPEQAGAWRVSARLTGSEQTQADVACAAGVTTRTVRAWVRRVDDVLARSLTAGPAQPPATSGPGSPDPVEVGTALAQLTRDLVNDGATTEQLEAVQAFAADRLGGPRPRRGGARRWARKRAYDTIQERLDIILRRPLALGRLSLAEEKPTLLVVPYQFADDPTAVVAELEQAWARRDRTVLPLLANHAVRILRAQGDVSINEQILALAVIANALRDAENLQAMPTARMWRQLALWAGGPRDFRAWMAHGVIIHMLQIHGHLRTAAQAQRRHIEAFAHLDFPPGNDRAWHEQDRFARLVSIELSAGLPGGLERAERTVRRMRLIQDAGAGDIDDAHAAVRRRRIEVLLARDVLDSRGQAIGVDPQLDRLVTELERTLLHTAGQRSLSAIDLLIHIDIARRDWPSLTPHIEWARQAAGQIGAAPNLIERINDRLWRVAHRTRLARHVVKVPPDLLRDHRFLPPRVQ